ncbi:MAG TPA: 30S ribosomal protein S19 [Candidatus Thermoplasmatota archaeon]|nr:30S ribosomal protein S19 [Candidatus Thermoplasmatota archaeon]
MADAPKGFTPKAVRRPRRKVETGKKKEFLYRGHTLDELRALSMEELASILPARVRRDLRRGLAPGQRHLLERLGKAPPEAILRTHCRDMPVLPSFVGRTLAVHNGKEFARVEVQPDMIGHYLGEFALTRKAVKHTGPGVGATRGSKFIPLK